VTTAFACCRDLRAACRTPFNGVACADVDAFCKDDVSSAKLLHWAQHKLHRAAECAAYSGTPYDFRPLSAIMAANQRDEGSVTAVEDTAALIKAAVGATEPATAAAPAARAFASNRVAAAVIGVGGMLVGIALVGMAMTLRTGTGAGHGAGADDAIEGGAAGVAEPLLYPVPEVANREDEVNALRHVISSNYLLASAPPTPRTGGASPGSFQEH
jgi:hypothetical protein